MESSFAALAAVCTKAAVDASLSSASARAAAADPVEVMLTTGGTLLIISSKELRTALQSRVDGGGIFRVREDGARETIAGLDIPLLQVCLDAVYQRMDEGDAIGGDIAIKWDTIAAELGYDKRQGGAGKPSRKAARDTYLYRAIARMGSVWGTLEPHGIAYALLAFHSYDPESSILTFRAPYLSAIADALLRRKAADRHGQTDKQLLMASAAACKDKIALEAACYILAGLVQLGKRRTRYYIGYQTLIDSCPQFAAAMAAAKDTKARSTYLRRHISALSGILHNYTHLSKIYSGLCIACPIPTATKAASMGVEITFRAVGSGDPEKAAAVGEV